MSTSSSSGTAGGAAGAGASESAPRPLAALAPDAVASSAPGGGLDGALAPVLAALERLERRLERVEQVAATAARAVELTATLPAAVSVLVDTVDGIAAKLGEAGVDLDERMRSVGRAVEVATTPRAVSGLASLVESKLLDPSALAVVSQLAAALAEPGAAPPVGMWGALRALRDEDVQRALGFMLAVARQFGQHLGAGDVAMTRRRLDVATSHLLESP